MEPIILAYGTHLKVIAAIRPLATKCSSSCGPSGFGANRIPSGKAVIPDYVWKIAVFVPTNSGTALSRITATTRVIALKVPNTFPVANKWTNFITSVAQIEADTGFTFFTALLSDVAAVLRNATDGSQTNPPPVVFAFLPATGAAGTNVVITGTNFLGATAVTFNGASASYTVNSSNQITAGGRSHERAGSGFISVTTPSGTAVSTSTASPCWPAAAASVYAPVCWRVGMSALCSNYGPSVFAPTTNAANLSVVELDPVCRC